MQSANEYAHTQHPPSIAIEASAAERGIGWSSLAEPPAAVPPGAPAAVPPEAAAAPLLPKLSWARVRVGTPPLWCRMPARPNTSPEATCGMGAVGRGSRSVSGSIFGSRS